MMGNLAPGLKTHAVTMYEVRSIYRLAAIIDTYIIYIYIIWTGYSFNDVALYCILQVGKLSDESLDDFLLELDKVSSSDLFPLLLHLIQYIYIIYL